MPGPAVFMPSIRFASIFDPNSDPIALDPPIAYTGKRLFCHVDAAGATLAFHVSDQFVATAPCPVDGRPEVLPGIAGGPFTAATIDVSYEGHVASMHVPATIAYFGGPMTFNLRFDADFTHAAVYFVEIPPGGLFNAFTAELDARVDAVAPVTDMASERGDLLGAEFGPDAGPLGIDVAEPAPPAEKNAKDRSHQIFFVAVNDGKIPKLPLKAVFIQNRIIVPPGSSATGALIPPEDGGSEHGPMGLRA